MALVDAAAPSSECPLTISAGFDICFEERTLVIRIVFHRDNALVIRTPSHRDIHARSNAAAPVTPHEPTFTKGEKTCLDSRPTRMQNFTPLALSTAEKSVTVQRNKKTKKNKCISRLARRIPHHTALVNTAAPNSDCLPSLATGFDICLQECTLVIRILFHRDRALVIQILLHRDIHPGSNAAAPMTPREPIFTKGENTCPVSRPTHIQNFTPLAFCAAEKSITIQKNKQNYKITHSKLSIPHTTIWWDKNVTCLKKATKEMNFTCITTDSTGVCGGVTVPGSELPLVCTQTTTHVQL